MQFVFVCVHLLTFTIYAVHLEKRVLIRDIHDGTLVSMHINLLNSPPRGNLVDGLPRAASCDNCQFFIEVLYFDGDHFARDESSR